MPNQFTTPRDIRIRFWSKVAITAHPDRCWEWQAGCNKYGYGKFKRNTQPCRAHRVAWELINGDIPDGLHVLHTCDNRKCCNPKHLFLGTNQDNMDDKVAKGRQHKVPTGERHPNHKISREQMHDIRKRYNAGGISHRGLALETGLSRAQIGRILKGTSWQHD